MDDTEQAVQKKETEDACEAVTPTESLDENDPVLKIPNEVWVLILSELNQKELVQARTVWKKWREVVDSHFDFTVIVHDGKTDLERIYELRIRDCLITRLLGDKDIFQFPSLLKRVRFWGPVNVKSFQRIMDQAVAVEEFSLTKFALMQENLLGMQRLCGFSKIKKLELLGYMCKDESKAIAKNSSAIFTYDMPDLEKLTINFHCDIASINQIAVSFMSFISRHHQLHNLAVSLVPEASHPNEEAAVRVTSIIIPKAVEESLQNVQLSVLRITTATKDLPLWTALLNSQTRLQDFRMNVSEGGLLTVNTTYTPGIPFDLLREPLLRNASTLTSVELKELRLVSSQAAAPADFTPADASVFRYASKLKKLVLYRNTDDFRRFPQYPDLPNIINLKMLPTSIEVLEISRFYCQADELQFVADVLENLKIVTLVHTGSLSRLGVHGGIVESISMKTDIQNMNITPLNYYCSIENKKYDAVKAKFGMNDGDHLYYDFEKFRKGLPQPRPPTVEPTRVPPSFYNNDVGRFNRRWHLGRSFQSHSSGVRRTIRQRNALMFRTFNAERSSNVSRLERFETLMARFSLSLNVSYAAPQCQCDDPFHEGSPVGRCSRDHHLSRLFRALDIQLTKEQASHQLKLQHLPSRERRWSGDVNTMFNGAQKLLLRNSTSI